MDRDEAIMMAVVKQLRAQDCDVDVVNEDGPWSLTAGYDMVLTMGRRPETLSRLSAAGVRSINSSEAVARCQRSRLSKIMREEGIPMPPEMGSDGFWLKRGDVAGSMSDKDVMFAYENGTTGIKNFDIKSFINNFLIVIPSEEDIIKFNNSVKDVFDIIMHNGLEIEKLANLRDTLLPKLMSGEIDVSQINCDF